MSISIYNQTAESMLAKCIFLVEATSFEKQSLWSDHAKQSIYPPQYVKRSPVDWEEMNPAGWIVTVGHIGKRPICVSLSFAVIDGQLIGFWEMTSQVTDSVKVEKWLAKHFGARYDNLTRPATCDAWNFGHCLCAIREANEKTA